MISTEAREGYNRSKAKQEEARIHLTDTIEYCQAVENDQIPSSFESQLQQLLLWLQDLALEREMSPQRVEDASFGLFL